MTPHESAGLYFCLSMVGSASAVIIVTDAPMMPVIAARMVPMMVTPRASAPGTRLRRTCTQ